MRARVHMRVAQAAARSGSVIITRPQLKRTASARVPVHDAEKVDAKRARQLSGAPRQVQRVQQVQQQAAHTRQARQAAPAPACVGVECMSDGGGGSGSRSERTAGRRARSRGARSLAARQARHAALPHLRARR